MPVYSERDVSSESATTSSSSSGADVDIETLLGNEALQKLLNAGIGVDLQDYVLDGGVLEVGDRGNEVAQLQAALGYLSPDGVLGPMTEGSLLRLQQAMGIPVTGVLDAVTLLAIADIRTGTGPAALLFQHQSGGASAATASQDGLEGGVDASIAMADTDEARLMPYLEIFEEVAAVYDLPAPILMAIASRETRGGSLLDSVGYSIYDGNGYGLMQVDRNHHTPQGGPFSREHIAQAADILAGMLRSIEARHSDWTPAEQLRGAVCGYNTGTYGIQTVGGMDSGTTGKDYSGDVWIRAQRYARLFQLDLV